jgi:hypothetical protein
MTATGYTGLNIICRERGGGLDVDMIAGGRTQQDAFREIQTYRIYGTGS